MMEVCDSLVGSKTAQRFRVYVCWSMKEVVAWTKRWRMVWTIRKEGYDKGEPNSGVRRSSDQCMYVDRRARRGLCDLRTPLR